MTAYNPSLAPHSSQASIRRPAKVPRVLIVDDFPCARAGLRAFLAERMAVSFLPDASDARTALETAHREPPDLVLLEVAMVNGDGPLVLQRLRSELPDVRVLATTISQDLELVAATIREGVHGYLIKTADQDALVAAAKRVLAGQMAIDPMLVIRAMQASAAPRPVGAEQMPEDLTVRELEVLRLVSRGHTNREIAGQLFVAVGTVKVHLEHILAKLGAADRTQAAVRAQTMGLLDRSAGRHMPSGVPDLAERPTRDDHPRPQTPKRSALSRRPHSDTAGE